MSPRPQRLGNLRSSARIATAALALGFALASCGTDASSEARLKQYEGKGFTIKYPASWQPHPKGKMVSDARLEVVKLNNGSSAPYASIHVRLNRDPGTLKGTVNVFLAESRLAKDFKLINQKEVEVRGDKEGFLVRKSYSPKQQNFRLRQTDLLTLTEAGKTLDVRLVCRVNFCKRYDKTFDAVLDSVRIMKS